MARQITTSTTHQVVLLLPSALPGIIRLVAIHEGHPMTPDEFQNPHLEGDSFLWESGPTGVLLIHGFTATTAEVRPLARHLHEAGYTVAGPLLPGHGSTPADLNQCRYADWIDCVEDAYQRLVSRSDRVVAGGESMGGLLALYLASQHPEIAAVLTFAPALKVPSRILPLLAPLLAPVIPTMAKSAAEPSPADPLWQGYTVYPVPAAAQLFKLQRVVRRLLPRVTQPALVVQGKLDRSVDPEVPDIICRSVSSTIKEVHWFNESGHCVVLDAEREAVAQLAESFVGRVLGKAN